MFSMVTLEDPVLFCLFRTMKIAKIRKFLEDHSFCDSTIRAQTLEK